LLAQQLEWSYSDDMLYDPEKNTALAALYLDMLHSIHKGDIEMVLAEYNGGTRNARYYRQKSSRIAPETSQYVVKGKNVYRRLRASLGLDTATFLPNGDLFLDED
jgi:soluble lytic murein transglycosylase